MFLCTWAITHAAVTQVYSYNLSNVCCSLSLFLSTVADDCGPLDAPNDGSVSISGTIVGSTATYTCNDGFRLQGQSTRTCQTNGEWSGSAPICQRKLDVANLYTHPVFSSTNIVPADVLRFAWFIASVPTYCS